MVEHLSHAGTETVFDDPQPLIHRDRCPHLRRPVYGATDAHTPVNRLVRRGLLALIPQAVGPRGKKPLACPARGEGPAQMLSRGTRRERPEPDPRYRQ